MNLYDFIVLFSSGVAVLMALSLLMRPLKFRNAVVSILLFLAGYMQFFAYLFESRMIFDLPHLLFTQVPVGYSLGPLFYLYVQSIVHDTRKMQMRDWLHFVPVGVLLLILIPAITLPADEKVRMMREFLQGEYPSYRYISAAIIGSYGVYIVVSIRRMQIRRRGNWAHRRIIVMAFLMLSFLLLGIIKLFGILTLSDLLMRVNNLLTAVAILMLFLSVQRYPFLFQYGVLPSERKASRSHLERVDLKNVQKNLLMLMEDEKFYCDEDLTLSRLSDALEITPHQLSALLNEHYNMNFNSFVNGYRIAESRKLLVDVPGRSTLSIAYAVGFNSYTTFYSSFKRATGLSPAHYRRTNLGRGQRS